MEERLYELEDRLNLLMLTKKVIGDDKIIGGESVDDLIEKAQLKIRLYKMQLSKNN
jgi:hypothetical protein